MSTDPYDAVKQEIEASLQNAQTLRASLARIRSMRVRADSEELQWAVHELSTTLDGLAADLDDLDESVKIVESTDARLFGLDDAQVLARRRYVAHVRAEIESMRAELAAPPPAPPLPPPGSRAGSRAGSRPTSPRPGADPPDEQSAWEREQQQMMIREQDRTMDSIAGTLSTLAQQAGLMGQEIGEHTEMLDDLERNVDRTEGRLSDAMRRMRKFMRETEETKSGWCVVILIIVLLALLVAVILV